VKGEVVALEPTAAKGYRPDALIDIHVEKKNTAMAWRQKRA
jgi:hypothetical protein